MVEYLKTVQKLQYLSIAIKLQAYYSRTIIQREIKDQAAFAWFLIVTAQ